MLLIVASVGFAVSKSTCNSPKLQVNGDKNIHGYLLVGYPVKNLDSTCLKNLSGALLQNNCIIAMNEYFVDVIPDFMFGNNFDSIYKKDAEFEAKGGIIITKFDKRFTGSDISDLLHDSTLKKSKKELIPSAKNNSKIYFNRNAKPQSFVYRIFEFEGNYINKKIKNTSDAQRLIEGMTNLVYDNIKTDTLDIYFFNSFRYLREVSTAIFKSNTFNAIE